MDSNRQLHQYNLRSSVQPNPLDFSAAAAVNTSAPPSLPSSSSTTSMTSTHVACASHLNSSAMAQAACPPSSQFHQQQQQPQHQPWGQPESSMPLMASHLPPPQNPQHHQSHARQGFTAVAASAPPTENLPPQNEMDMDMDAPAGSAATAPFLRDFTLVAEAVKRVQMEVVMSEMESITL